MNEPKPTDSEQLAKVLANRMSLLQVEDHHIHGISQADEARLEHYVSEIMQLIQQRDQQRLSAALEALPNDSYGTSRVFLNNLEGSCISSGYRMGIEDSKAALTAALGPDNSKIEE